MTGGVGALWAYLRARGAFLLTFISWVALSAFAAIPFMLDPVKLSLTNAMFEAVSGITTTGSTILTGLDNMPKGILLWRAITQSGQYRSRYRFGLPRPDHRLRGRIYVDGHERI